MVIIAVVLLIFIGLIIVTRVRADSSRRRGFMDGGIPSDGAQAGSHHHNHHHDGGSWGGHHGGFDGGAGGHH